jgi:hypothetical protein
VVEQSGDELVVTATDRTAAAALRAQGAIREQIPE